MTEPTLREQALAAFVQATAGPDITHITQRGRDQDARFTITLRDGRDIHIGTIDTLWSQAKLARALAVTTGTVIQPLKPAEWRTAIAALIHHAVQVHETPDETGQAILRDWIAAYAANAAETRDDSAILKEPFTHDGHLHIYAQGLARYIRRESGDKVNLADLYATLADLGFHRAKINVRSSAGTRSSVSYYRGPQSILDPEDHE